MASEKLYRNTLMVTCLPQIMVSSQGSKYSGTPLIRSPMGQKDLAVLTGWSYYRGRPKFHDLMAVVTNTPYIAFTVLFSLTNNRNVDIGTVIEKTT